MAEALFGGLAVDTLLLEYDDERSGGFEPLRFIPPGTNVVLGLVTTKSPALEQQNQLRRRIDEATRYVPPRTSGAQPPMWLRFDCCGEPPQRSTNSGAKLELVVETARRVWG